MGASCSLARLKSHDQRCSHARRDGLATRRRATTSRATPSRAAASRAAASRAAAAHTGTRGDASVRQPQQRDARYDRVFIELGV